MDLPISDLQVLGGGGIAIAIVWMVLSFLKGRSPKNENGIESRLDTMIGEQKKHNGSSDRIEAELKTLNTKFEEFWKETLRLRSSGGDD